LLLEHLLYSAAVALIVGMIFLYFTGRDPSWIIILMTIAPDSDWLVGHTMYAIGLRTPFILNHGDFHNIMGLIIFSICAALILYKCGGIIFSDAFICSVIGYLCHFVEDFIVYPPAYAYLYPFNKTMYGINFIPETGNLLVAGTEVLSVGILVFVIAFFIRWAYHKGEWSIYDYVNDWSKVWNHLKYCVKILWVNNII
jgi:membrane-bound metal-dependent hydrolase YbcI (DUF457 family)